jgi:hypothetical protein
MKSSVAGSDKGIEFGQFEKKQDEINEITFFGKRISLTSTGIKSQMHICVLALIFGNLGQNSGDIWVM